MNDSEKRVHGYLTGQGFRSVVHEPDGKVPPAFLVDDRIAVEVRRLNQNEKTARGHRGLEEVSKPLNVLVEKAIASAGPPVGEDCWFVFYTYRRPLPPWKTLDNLLRTALREVTASPSIGNRDVRVAGRIRLRFTRATKVHPTLFVLGGSADHDSGGFVVSEMARNLRLCIAEKQAKIARVRTKYSEWWLILDDRIGFGGWMSAISLTFVNWFEWKTRGAESSW